MNADDSPRPLAGTAPGTAPGIATGGLAGRIVALEGALALAHPAAVREALEAVGAAVEATAERLTGLEAALAARQAEAARVEARLDAALADLSARLAAFGAPLTGADVDARLAAWANTPAARELIGQLVGTRPAAPAAAAAAADTGGAGGAGRPLTELAGLLQEAGVWRAAGWSDATQYAGSLCSLMRWLIGDYLGVDVPRGALDRLDAWLAAQGEAGQPVRLILTEPGATFNPKQHAALDTGQPRAGVPVVARLSRAGVTCAGEVKRKAEVVLR